MIQWHQTLRQRWFLKNFIKNWLLLVIVDGVFMYVHHRLHLFREVVAATLFKQKSKTESLAELVIAFYDRVRALSLQCKDNVDENIRIFTVHHCRWMWDLKIVIKNLFKIQLATHKSNVINFQLKLLIGEFELACEEVGKDLIGQVSAWFWATSTWEMRCEGIFDFLIVVLEETDGVGIFLLVNLVDTFAFLLWVVWIAKQKSKVRIFWDTDGNLCKFWQPTCHLCCRLLRESLWVIRPLATFLNH